MFQSPILKLALSLVLFTALNANARDYRNKEVGDYSHASLDLSVDRDNVTFLTFMKNKLFAVIKNEAPNQSHWTTRNYLHDIKNGVGAELRLAPNVTTYHVGYSGPEDEEAHKSGRSFGVYDRYEIKDGTNADYIADASYKFYLDELEKVLKDKEQAKLFYQAIFTFIVKTDSRGFKSPDMSSHTKRVAADFVAVYIAEQYRRLVHSDGKWLDRRNWDNAHLQVTILANFHAGQSRDEQGMFFGGGYMTDPYWQKDSRADVADIHRCAYNLLKNDRYGEGGHDNKWLKHLGTRPFRLSDYWQYGKECPGPSGVNVTRRDFEKLGKEITKWMNSNSNEEIEALFKSIWENSGKTMSTRRNVIDAVAEGLISNDDTPTSYENSEALIEALVNYTMMIREQAGTITKDSLL